MVLKSPYICIHWDGSLAVPCHTFLAMVMCTMWHLHTLQNYCGMSEQYSQSEGYVFSSTFETVLLSHKCNRWLPCNQWPPCVWQCTHKRDSISCRGGLEAFRVSVAKLQYRCICILWRIPVGTRCGMTGGWLAVASYACFSTINKCLSVVEQGYGIVLWHPAKQKPRGAILQLLFILI